MTLRFPGLRALVAGAAAVAVFSGAAPRRLPLTIYSAPAGRRPAGASAQRPTAAVLPDGRIAAPVGEAIFVGTNPQGVALSPNEQWAVVANDGTTLPPAPQPLAAKSDLVAGDALVVVNARTMRVSDVYHAPGNAFSGGVAVVADPENPANTLVLATDAKHDVVRVFDLSANGTLSADAPIALPLASAPGYAINGVAGPSALVVAPDGKVVYVAERGGDIVAAVDLMTRTVLGGVAVGFSPESIAATQERVYAGDAGLAEYRVAATPARTPSFAQPETDDDRASSLAVVPLDASGAPQSTDSVSFLRMDSVPDGVRNVGGIIPSAIVTRADGRYAYVALANIDRVAIVDLTATPRVVNGLDLRLFPNAPYGTQPSAEALSSNGTRLYVALGGLNAVAVLDAKVPTKLHRLGLVPTGWYPSALALSRDGRYLYVASSKGVGGWGVLQRVDLRHLPLGPATLSALRYNRVAAYAKENTLVPPLRSNRRSAKIRHVIYVSVGIDDYDAVLGDLTDASGGAHGNGSPSYELYPASVTPNLHALARTFALADNLYAGSDAAAMLQLATAATVTLPVERDAAGAADPESYPRAGYVFNALSRAHESFRDYGALFDVSGLHDGRYTLDVPALDVLDGNFDPDYDVENADATDATLAHEFVRDFTALSQQDRIPDFTFVRLPTTAGGEGAADRALGTIVDAVTHAPQWSSTALFVVPEYFAVRRDHVDGSRIYAIVVSPYARRGFVDGDHLSVPSVVKTEEELLGLPPLAVSDLLATDMAECFTESPDLHPYVALP